MIEEETPSTRPRGHTVPPPPDPDILNDGTVFYMRMLGLNKPKPKKKSNDSIKIPPEYEPY